MGDSGTATTRERPLIGAAQQVRHLKDRGVRFELTDEREAERFLRESNFFFKVKAFAKCFSRYTNPDSEHFGSYINLDFAHLAGSRGSTTTFARQSSPSHSTSSTT
jgi:hypothetical protein